MLTTKSWSPAVIGSLLAATCCLIVSSCTVVDAFAPQPAVTRSRGMTTPTANFATATASSEEIILSQSSLDKLESIKFALKRPRGASIGVDYAPSNALSDGDLSILSMQLRKSAKCAAIWTSDASSVGRLAKEQEGSRGDFPGPVPIIYCGEELEAAVKLAGDESAAAVVVDYNNNNDDGDGSVDMDLLTDVGIIWRVSSLAQLQELSEMENNGGGVYLLSSDLLPQSAPEEEDKEHSSSNELKEALAALPKSTIAIAPLPTMQSSNSEIPLAKHYASLGISSLLLQKACVGDEEDVKYTSWAIESITKKSSSSFSMTGLTGSTNGHFGVSSHGGEVKWRRTELNGETV